MSEDLEDDKYGLAYRIWRSLNLQRVFLTILLGAGLLVIYALWDQRDKWTPYFWQSQPFLIAILVGGVLIAVGAALQSFQKRVDNQNSQIYQHTRDQLNDMRREIEAGRAAIGDQARHIMELTAQERVCQERLYHLRRDFEELKQQTGFGDLPHEGPK